MDIVRAQITDKEYTKKTLIYPETDADSVKVGLTNVKLPVGLTNVQDVVNNLGSSAFNNSNELIVIRNIPILTTNWNTADGAQYIINSTVNPDISKITESSLIDISYDSASVKELSTKTIQYTQSAGSLIIHLDSVPSITVNILAIKITN